MDWRPFGETELLGQILQDQQWALNVLVPVP
ncbi:uncharacterized protein FFB20_09208 [Fusarium fujikuroi]|nr:uncharacterized protein FFC1_03222 [Fusarium fujikuroi]SCN92425.1 uncharacterized protein FFB20_09208 [Fusarium fujikuroi]SCO32092.1 uncharacterized protein FFNC_02679 [Fusarium fujikuroi]